MKLVSLVRSDHGFWCSKTCLNARTPYPTDWPSMASVVALKRPSHPHLPSAITLPHKEVAPEYTRPGQFAARLGIESDPVFTELF
jgi:hypothetical protein